MALRSSYSPAALQAQGKKPSNSDGQVSEWCCMSGVLFNEFEELQT